MLFGLAGLPPAGELHGDMTQAARLESLERFRKVRRAINAYLGMRHHCKLWHVACVKQVFCGPVGPG